MNNDKYIICFIIGIILFILWNSINRFSIGAQTEEEIQDEIAAIEAELEAATVDQLNQYYEDIEAGLEGLHDADDTDDTDMCSTCFDPLTTESKEQNTCKDCYYLMFVNQLKLYLKTNIFSNVQEYLNAIKEGKINFHFKFVPPSGMTIIPEELEKLDLFEMLTNEKARILLMKLIVHERGPDPSFEEQLMDEGDSPIMLQYWRHLTDINREDLTTLGWIQLTWDGEYQAGTDPDSGPYAQNWAQMSRDKRDAAIRLGQEFVDHYRSVVGPNLCEIELSDRDVIRKHIKMAKSLGIEKAKSLGIDMNESDFTGVSECCGGSSGPSGLGGSAGGGSSGPSGLGGSAGGGSSGPSGLGGLGGSAGGGSSGPSGLGGAPDWQPEDIEKFVDEQYEKYNRRIHRDVIRAALNNKTRNLFNCYLRSVFKGNKWGKNKRGKR